MSPEALSEFHELTQLFGSMVASGATVGTLFEKVARRLQELIPEPK